MKPMTYKVLTASLIATGMFLGGCNSSSSTDPEATTDPETTNLEVKTPAQLIARSAADIDENQSGLVSAATVKAWVDDWEQNRPENIEGRLFIMQFGTAMSGDDPNKYIKSIGETVITLDGSGISGLRNDGVSDVPSSLPSGTVMDARLAELGINPNKDMLLIVAGNGEAGSVLQASRLWYTMAYWGVKPENMALMNGSALYQFHPDNNSSITDLSDIFVSQATAPPGNGKTSVKDIPYDATSIHASMQDMMNLVTGVDQAYMVVDARSSDEYSGAKDGDGKIVKKTKTEEKTCGSDGKSQCYVAFEGHIKGAANINYTTLYNGDDQSGDLNGDGKTDAKDASATFKNLDELEAIYAAAGYKDGDTLYTYCRTGTRASINTFVQMQILGYPTAMYDASWTQWGKMAYTLNKNSDFNMREGNQWRTDLEKYSDSVTENSDSSDVQQINGFNAEGLSTRAIIEEDQAYKQ